MTRPLFVFFLFLVIVLSCKKEDDDNTPIIEPELSGLHDLSITTGKSAVIVLEAKLGTSDKDSVWLTLSDTPDGVTATLSPSYSNVNFACILNITVNNSAVIGHYPLWITLRSAGGKTKEYQFNLEIRQSLMPQLVGEWRFEGTGIDSNGNGVYDPGEAESVTYSDWFLLRADYTGERRYRTNWSSPIQWRVLDDQYLLLSIDNAQVMYLVSNISQDELILSFGPVIKTWLRYSRQ